jgi:catalase (peroxidase I)
LLCLQLLEPKKDYAAVRAAIEKAIESNPDYDDGSYGPVLVRLAWHASGTYDKATDTGGSDGATMRWVSQQHQQQQQQQPCLLFVILTWLA